MSNLFVLIFLFIFLFGCFFLTKKLCYGVGLSSLVLGTILPASLWIYAEFFIKGDQSSYGMMGTVIAFVLIPPSIGLILAGLIKSKQ